MSFDDYQKSDGAMCMHNDFNRKIYEAGAQSRQAEVDELQNRIDDVAKRLESIKADNLRPRWRDYDKGWRDCAITVLNDLKGKENEH